MGAEMDEIGMRHDGSVALTGAAEKRLPVLAIAARSYAFLWQEWRILVLPAALLGVLSLLIDAAVMAILSAILLAGFEVGLYRRVLLGERLSGWRLLWVTRGLGAYAIAAIQLLLCLTLVIVILALPAYLLLQAASDTSIDSEIISASVGLAILVPAVLFILRLVLILPGRIVGESISLRESWRATRGNWAALLALMLLTMLPFSVLPLLFPRSASLLLVLSIPVRTVALALSYRLLTGSAASEASAGPSGPR